MQSFGGWVRGCCLHLALVCAGLSWSAAEAHHDQTDDLLNDNPTYSDFKLELRPWLTMPANQNNIISTTTRLGDSRLYVTTQQGNVYVANPNANGTATPALFLNVKGSLPAGITSPENGGQGGLQSIAFHPQFDQVGSPGYGKLFTTMVCAHSNSANFLGSSSSNIRDGVLAEFTYNHTTGTLGGYRELFRVNMVANDHPIKQARFNPYSEPGDEDYGLLYLTHGDSNAQHSPGDHPQLLDNALGKMLRVDPLDPDGAGSARYSVPTSNPFYNYSGPTPAGHATVLPEIYAYGFRNPHTFSFNRDDRGAVHILVGNIGRANVEEVDVALPGHNYGWPKREGTFVEKQVATSGQPNPGTIGSNYGYVEGTAPLPENEANLVDGYGNRSTYPVAQFDHNAEYALYSSDSSIASGFVIRNGSDPNLHNQLLFNNFPEHDSFMYHADFDDMLAAVTTLDPGDESRDEPGELTQAPLSLLKLALDHDNNPGTPAQVFDDVNSMLADTRNDTRYGEGVFGEMYISTKRKGGVIYLVTNSMPLLGDFNKDHIVDAADYTVWRNTLDATGYHLAADGNGDGKVDSGDYLVWRKNFGQTWSATGAGSLSIPEPATAALLAVFTLLFLARRFDRRFAH